MNVSSASQEARALWRLRARLFRSLARRSLQEMRFRVVVVALVSLFFWIGLFLLFSEGFVFLQQSFANSGMLVEIVQIIYNTFFLTLMVMLFFSSAVLAYGALFRHDESTFLLTTPASAERIVLYKLQEAVLFSGWGFLLLGTPMLIAYGVAVAAPWQYYLLLGPYLVGFVVLPSGAGVLACLLTVSWLPQLRMIAFALLITAATAAFGWYGYSALNHPQHELMTPGWLENTLHRMSFSQQKLFPSWWLSSGLLQAAHPGEESRPHWWLDSAMLLGVLWANALFCVSLVQLIGGRVFRGAYSSLQGLGGGKKNARRQLPDVAMRWICRPLPRAMRAIIEKDARVFRRDPVQWVQFLIFFGLMALYFLNLQRFTYGQTLTPWMMMISFLNLGVAGLILSTFTTRFVFPMVSLEGRRFWILGASPLPRNSVLWAKFWFACVGSLPPCAALTLLSDIKLQIVSRAPFAAVAHQAVCWVMCVGLAALAVGLGARFPDFKETSPAKIAAGFGGTLNLVLSAVFIVTVVLLTAIPTHLWVSRVNYKRAWEGSIWQWIGWGTPGSVAAAVACALAIGAVVTFASLKIGFRAFRRLEV